MKNKQIIGIVVAGIVFMCVSSLGIFTNYLFNKSLMNVKNSVISTNNLTGYTDIPLSPYVGLVTVEGSIINTASTEFLFPSGSYSHRNTLDYIDIMMTDDNNKGILLFVNSPGGGVYESDELYLKLAEYKEKTGRMIWTYMGSQACSGGYYIAMASDKIVANRNCWTGSVGVIISMTNLTGLYEKLGIQEINITSGGNKAMGSAGENLSQEQHSILQGIVDESYSQFVEIVSLGRNMAVDQVKELADGRIYTAKQAAEKGMIDEIAEYNDTVLQFLDEIGDGAILYEPKLNTSWISSLLAKWRGIRPKSDAELLTEYLKNQGNGVPMYYAEP